MDQFIEVFKTKVIAEWNKIDPNWQIYLVKASRGNIWPDRFGLIHVIKSEKDRSKYINADESYTDLQKAVNAKLTPFLDELKKYGSYNTIWTDWVVQ